MTAGSVFDTIFLMLEEGLTEKGNTFRCFGISFCQKALPLADSARVKARRKALEEGFYV